ncbi:hypothetical protein KXD40_005980 [Peronospora effusa]|uniref:Uncharacterized protein n=1 Tax=Peronospora effusa TaxID=542832 RepID=A0A3M6V814_9STRA|nr:hypothetical protein DD238_007367 [Peronospora effusa]UIZ25986.1 hypothetical protein KXD40_005980 [Peronospora effusa]
MTLTVCTVTVDGDVAMYAKVKESEEMSARLMGGRRLILKQQSKHEAKMQEEDQMKTHLEVLRSRFDMYASESMEETNGRRVKTMIVTGFLHSFVLPQFCLHSPVSLRTALDYITIAIYLCIE